MINKILLKQTFKINRKILFSISILIVLFLIIMGVGYKISRFNEINNDDELNSGFIGALGSIGSSLDELKHRNSSTFVYLVCSMYPMLFWIFIMIYVIITSNSLIANQVDKGSMAYTLSTPISRKEISLTQSFYFVISLIFINVCFMCSGFIALTIVGNSGHKQFEQFSLISLGSFLLSFALSSILFVFSTIFNTNGKAFTFGIGFSVLCYVFFILGYMSDRVSNSLSLEWLRIFQYVSLNSLFVAEDVKNLDIQLLFKYIILFIIGISGFGIGNLVFSKKDLPL